jgi:hypothetical protein
MSIKKMIIITIGLIIYSASYVSDIHAAGWVYYSGTGHYYQAINFDPITIGQC